MEEVYNEKGLSVIKFNRSLFKYFNKNAITAYYNYGFTNSDLLVRNKTFFETWENNFQFYGNVVFVGEKDEINKLEEKSKFYLINKKEEITKGMDQFASLFTSKWEISNKESLMLGSSQDSDMLSKLEYKEFQSIKRTKNKYVMLYGDLDNWNELKKNQNWTEEDREMYIKLRKLINIKIYN